MLVDDEDFEELNKHKWRYQRGYAVRTDNSSNPPAAIYMHRQIMGFPIGMDVDHINMLKGDNQKANLRIVTRSQNMANIRTRTTEGKHSKYKGVSLLKRPNLKKPWLATIKIAYKQLHLGYFATQEEAALAYNEAAIKHSGDSAQLNVIDPPTN